MSAGASLRLLLVEDDADIARVAQLALGIGGEFDVVAADSGEEALRRAAERAPDVVLLDVMMPGMDGPTTYAKLRDLPGCGETPVIFMTARAQADEVRRYLDLGAVGVIAKPFDPMTLSASVRSILAGDGPGGAA